MADEFASQQAKPGGVAELDDEGLYSLCNNRYLWWLDHTGGMRNQWRLNDMFAQGFQWASLMPSQNRIIMPPTSRSRKKITLNLVKPWLLDTEAKLHIALPTFEVAPNTLSQQNKDAAQAGESYGQHLWRQLEMMQKYDEIVRMCAHYGNCFGALDWDETIGPLYSQRMQLPDATGESTDAAGNPRDQLFTLGDLRFDVISPECVITDEENTSIDEKPYVIIAKWMSLDNIRERWEAGGDVVSEKRASPQFDTAGMMDMTTGVRGRTMRYTDSEAIPGALVFKLYMKPQTSVPNGLVAVYANSVQLEKNEWPEEFRKMDGYPVVKFDWYKHPNVFRGISPIIDQIPLQREINITISQIRENLDMILALKWLNPHGSGVDDIDDIAGQIIDYVPGFRPEILQPGSVPAFVPRHLDFLLSAMEDVQILHKPSKGKVPAGVKSGVGIELLQEQDDRPLSVPENGLHRSLDSVFRKALQIASVSIDTDRMIEYVGPNRRRQVIAFKGADLRDNTNIHLSVVGGSSKSKTGIIKRILEFVQVGMYRKEGGGVDTKRVMDMIRVAHPDVLYEEEDRHADLQRDENDILWETAQPAPIPQEWEMHGVHLDELELEMNTVKWKKKAQEDAAFAKRFIGHREGHIQLMHVASQRAAIAAQNAAQEQAA